MKDTSLENLAISTFKKYNRLTVRERLSHTYTWAMQNKFLAIFGGVIVALAYYSFKGMYHDQVIANSDFKEYVELIKTSIDSLAQSIGQVLVPITDQDKVASVHSHYFELLANTKFAAKEINKPELSNMIETLTDNAHLYIGTSFSDEGLMKLNEFRPTVNELISTFSSDVKGTLLSPLAVICALVYAVYVPQINVRDEDYADKKETIKVVNEKIEYHIPNVFEKLAEFKNRELLYKLSIAYTRRTKDTESALDFLFLAKEEPEVIAGDFKKNFGKFDFRLTKNGNADISPDELVQFVESHIESLGSKGFDYGLVTFDSIGGYEDIKAELKLHAACFADIQKAAQEGVEGATGMRLIGPPGCGKTLLAEAFINEALRPFGNRKRSHYEIVSGADLRSEWYSRSEKNISRLYKRARARAPYIIFIDEGEELFEKRGSGHSADTAGTNQLLTEIGGIKRTDRVITIVATNRDEVMDEASKRYGRLGLEFEIDLPNEEGRKQIAKIHLNRLSRTEILEAFDYDLFAKRLDKATGADIAGIISKTYWERFREITLQNVQPYKLTTQHFLKAAEDYKMTFRQMGFRSKS